MGHDSSSKDTNGSVQNLSISNDAGLGNQSLADIYPVRLSSPQFIAKATSNDLHKDLSSA